MHGLLLHTFFGILLSFVRDFKIKNEGNANNKLHTPHIPQINRLSNVDPYCPCSISINTNEYPLIIGIDIDILLSLSEYK